MHRVQNDIDLRLQGKFGLLSEKYKIFLIIL